MLPEKKDIGKNTEKLTPVMEQFMGIKKNHQESILFFRMGDFYEMFMDDAVVGSELLGIALTSRNKDGKIPLCGFPYHSAEPYIGKIIRAGRSVAICEQIGDPKKKGIVEREVVKVITPGTVTSQYLLDEKENNFLLSVFPNPKKGIVGIAQIDVSTGEFLVSEFLDTDEYKNLESELFRINPGEILLPSYLKDEKGFWAKLFKESWKCCFVDEKSFCPKASEEKIKKFFNVEKIDVFGLELLGNAVRAAGCALEYVQNTQQSDLSHISTIKAFFPSDYMVLDEVTQKNLELTQTLAEKQKKGTLLWVLDKTKTPMGGRLLKKWLLQPLRDIERINSRLDAVEELKAKHPPRESIKDSLDGIKDIERIFGRIVLGHANPRDVSSLGASLKYLPALKKGLTELRASFYKDIGKDWTNCQDICNLISKFIVEEPPILVKEGGIIKKGVEPRIDELRLIQNNGNAWIAKFEKKERERTGISSLKVKFNKVFGYFIEVTRANLKNVPADYTRKQTTVNGERYITEELKEMEAQIINASEKSKALEYEIFTGILEKISSQRECVLQATRNVSALDVIMSLAETSLENGYTRPEVNNGDAFLIEGGRHPVLEQTAKDISFVANDTVLDEEENRLIIITGPNMAGKSTYMRQIALIGLMAHIGSFVPAKKVSLGVLDRIFSRIGASDNILKGHSTFMVEMTETAQILSDATDKSLVILDEIGRGTSTYDGLSIAWAVAECLCQKKRSKTIFATHYHELTELAKTMQGVKNCKVEVSECDEEITFLYNVTSGSANKSYGIAVAKLAGIPTDVVERSKKILSDLHYNETNKPKEDISSISNKKPVKSPIQLSLFDTPKKHPLFEEIKTIDINTMTPLKALNKIARWKKQVEKA